MTVRKQIVRAPSYAINHHCINGTYWQLVNGIHRTTHKKHLAEVCYYDEVKILGKTLLYYRQIIALYPNLLVGLASRKIKAVMFGADRNSRSHGSLEFRDFWHLPCMP
jgi:hypothetical protein